MAAVVRDLTAKVEALQRELAAKDAEVAALTEATQDLQSQDLQAARIIELSKKNRALNLALEREKQRSTKLCADLAAAGTSPRGPPAAAASPEAIEQIARGLVEQAAEAAEAAQKEAASWKEKLQQTANRMSQLEQKAFALEAENKKLVRALQREVGEEVPLAKVLDEGGDWKGRREQLLALREQVKQLKAAAGYAVVDSRQEQAAKQAIGKIVKDRSQDLDRLSGELAATKAELEAARAKCEGAVSRRKILEGDLSSIRQKVAVVLEKAANDDRLIAALKAELAAARRGGGGGGGGAPSSSSGGPRTDDELWQELGALRRRAAEQEEQIDRQEAIIVALQQQQRAPAAASTPTGTQPGGPGAGATAQGRSTLEGAMEHVRLLEVENSRLQELVLLLKARLDDKQAGGRP